MSFWKFVDTFERTNFQDLDASPLAVGYINLAFLAPPFYFF